MKPTLVPKTHVFGTSSSLPVAAVHSVNHEVIRFSATRLHHVSGMIVLDNVAIMCFCAVVAIGFPMALFVTATLVLLYAYVNNTPCIQQ